MKYLLKKTVTLALTSMLVLSPITVFASNTSYPDSTYNQNDIDEKFVFTQTTKENVRYSQAWSQYARVSPNMSTGNTTGSISTNTTHTFGTEVSGDIAGLNISTNRSISSSFGVSFDVPTHSNVYIGYRAYNTIEQGTRVVTIQGAGIQNRNQYTVTTPQYGEYALLNANTGRPLMILATESYVE